jgi:8-oxo-dGTP pyrophosphatase MutT (NUDIX family)
MVTVRPAARVLLVDSRDRILLFEAVDPRLPVPSLWITPGGAIEPGETPEQAAVRELREETGLASVDLGPCVWTREYTFPWNGEPLTSVERFYLARVEAHEVSLDGQLEDELMVLKRHHWWSLDEIRRSREYFVPRRLASFLEPLLAGELPAEPLDVGA